MPSLVYSSTGEYTSEGIYNNLFSTYIEIITFVINYSETTICLRLSKYCNT